MQTDIGPLILSFGVNTAIQGLWKVNVHTSLCTTKQKVATKFRFDRLPVRSQTQ